MKEEKFTKETIDNLAEKLLIGLTKEENEMVLEEFSKIDAQFNILCEIPGIKEVEPMSWCLDRTIDHLRSDEPSESIPIDEALSNCDVLDAGEVKVPRVVA